MKLHLKAQNVDGGPACGGFFAQKYVTSVDACTCTECLYALQERVRNRLNELDRIAFKGDKDE